MSHADDDVPRVRCARARVISKTIFWSFSVAVCVCVSVAWSPDARCCGSPLRIETLTVAFYALSANALKNDTFYLFTVGVPRNCRLIAVVAVVAVAVVVIWAKAAAHFTEAEKRLLRTAHTQTPGPDSHTGYRTDVVIIDQLARYGRLDGKAPLLCSTVYDRAHVANIKLLSCKMVCSLLWQVDATPRFHLDFYAILSVAFH